MHAIRANLGVLPNPLLILTDWADRPTGITIPKYSATLPPQGNHSHDLEHSLHQLLRRQHSKNINHEGPCLREDKEDDEQPIQWLHSREAFQQFGNCRVIHSSCHTLHPLYLSCPFMND